MKLKELKHNHSLTDLLKVLIFSILMITPLLSVATRCLYVICNKNAYQSAEITQIAYNKIETQVPTSYPTSFNELSLEYYYCFDDFGNDNFSSNQFLTIYPCDNFRIIVDDFTSQYIDEIYFENDEFIYPAQVYLTITSNDLSFKPIDDTGSNYLSIVVVGNFSFSGDFQLINLGLDENFNYFEPDVFLPSNYKIISYEEVESTTLDNVFEYSVNKLAESPILSWTQQTAIYTGVNTMTTQLGVNTPTIPMLIVYWFLLTVIYIIIDIIIKLFTWLTHMIGNKSV